MNWEQIWSTVQLWLVNVGIKIVIALIVLVVAFNLINLISKKLAAKLEKKVTEDRRIDKTIYRTGSYVLKIALKALVVIGLIAYLGLDTSGLTALIASLGVGVGLAVNGTLSNVAGGVLLLVTRPFRDDDYIAADGYEGTVEDIHLCSTKIRTTDNRVIYIPNGTLSTSVITNYTEKDTRRVDLTFSIDYADSFEKARDTILAVCRGHERILKEPAPNVRMTAHAASSVDLTLWVWCRKEDYWTVRYDLLEQVKEAFDREGLHIPFPQMDVHMR